jgi:hypothetical protein
MLKIGKQARREGLGKRLHAHRPTTLHLLAQLHGIPVEVEQVRCTECDAVITERTLRRADA